MDEQERSPRELDRHSQESVQNTDQNGFIKNPKGKLYLPESYLSKRSNSLITWLLLKQSNSLITWLLLKPSIKEKTAWDWLKLIFAPALIALIAGGFTLYAEFFQNYFSLQRDKAEKNRNQQALLIEYLDEISELVEKQLLTLNDEDNSKTQRTIARARTLSVLRALDSDRKGELIQFLSAAQLIKADRPIIDLNRANLKGAYLKGAYLKGANLEEANLEGADLERANLEGADLERADLREADLERADLREANLEGANLEGADLERAYLWEANLERAYLDGANLEGAYLDGAYLEGADLREANLEGAYLEGADLERVYLWEANLERANLGRADLEEANLRGANLRGADLRGTELWRLDFWRARELEPKQIKSACNWKQAIFSEEFKQKLAQEPDPKVDCSKWN